MIYIVLKGGLGNQLFQFGAALRLAKGDIHHIRFAFHDGVDRPYRLAELFDDQFLPKPISDEEIIKVQSEAERLTFISDELQDPFKDLSTLDQNYQVDKDYLLDGYFQSGKNLLALKSYIKSNGIEYKKPKSHDPGKYAKIVAHYRLGDYMRQDVQAALGVLNIGYLDRVVSTKIPRNQPITLFTDDSVFAKKYPAFENLNIIAGGNDLEVFHAFLNAEILITANSSFSLCAGLLSEKNKTIYRPAFWSRNILSDDLCMGFEDRKIHLIPNSFY